MLVSGYRSSRIRRIQIAHFAFHTCFGNFRGQNGKNTIDRADKNTTSGKTSSNNDGAMDLVIYVARRFRIKTRSLRHFGIFGNTVWGIT